VSGTGVSGTAWSQDSFTVQQGRLTDEEIIALEEPWDDARNDRYPLLPPMPRAIADVATAKALWACVEWLQDTDFGPIAGVLLGQQAQDTVKMVVLKLSNALLEAGIPRPEPGEVG